MRSLHHRLAVAVLSGLALVAGAGASARAGSEPALRVDEAAPFSPEELAEALRLRVGLEHQVEVLATGGRVTVTVDGRSRSIVLGAEHGPAAARVVALVAAGMVLDPSSPPAPGTDVGAAPGALHEAAPGPANRAGRFAATLTAPVEPYGAWGLGFAFDVERGAGPTRWTLGVGGEVRTVVHDQGEITVHLVSLPLRGGVATGNALRLGAGAVVVPYVAAGGRGDLGVLLGGGMWLGTRIATGATMDLDVQLGVDVMASQVEYWWRDTLMLRTGRVRPWIAIGGRWGWRR